MNEPNLFAALRAVGVDADDPEIRTAVRAISVHVDAVRQREGVHRARRCMEAMHAMLAYQLQHPDVDDMSSFEAAYDQDDQPEG